MYYVYEFPNGTKTRSLYMYLVLTNKYVSIILLTKIDTCSYGNIVRNTLCHEYKPQLFFTKTKIALKSVYIKFLIACHVWPLKW